MSERSVGRALLRFVALATAAAVAFGSASVAAFAQDDPTSSSSPTQTSAPEEPEEPTEVEPEPDTTKGDVNGVLYADKNRNGQQDPQEAIAGGKVEIFGDGSRHATTSDANGKFAFTGLVPGTYEPTYQLAGGWAVHHTNIDGDLIQVEANTITEVSARAERRYDEQLRATATLDRDSYQHSSNTTVRLSLTNTTDRPIDNIQAVCDREEVPNSLGRVEGWNPLKGNGLRLAPREQRTFVIVEEIPAAARQKGSVKLDCDFAPFADWNTDGPVVHDEAAVTGGSGTYTMIVGRDQNVDNRIDPSEVVEWAEVVLLHPQSGVVVAQGRSDKAGRIEFTGLAMGDYRAVVLGGWGFRDAGQDQVRITDQDTVNHRILKHSAPAELRATVKFDKDRYESHETVRMWLTVTNIGGQAAERTRLEHRLQSLDVPDEQWGDFRPNGPGIRILAGESRTFEVTGKIRDIWNGKLVVSRWIDYLGRMNPYNSAFRGEVEVVQTRGEITGVVYTDRNGNGWQDAGEAAAHVVVEANGGAPYGYLKTTTDVFGRFTFSEVPSGVYSLGYTLADGWLVHVEGDEPLSWVEPGAVVKLTARAERPYRETLKSSVVLDKASYAIGDTAKITVKLTNVGNREISGIQAKCNRIGAPNHLGGSDEDPMTGWGDLSYWGKGVTVSPGETKTLVVTEKVPTAARNKRRVVIACDFAPNPSHNTDGPYGFDWASVPGGTGGLEGPLFHDRNGNGKVDPGEGLSGTRIAVVTDKEDGFVVAETESDALGSVRFEKLPPGDFWLWVDGPWQFEGEHGGRVQIFGDVVTHNSFPVVPGPERPEPDYDDSDQGPEDDTDSGTYEDIGTGGALAKTGASVLGLGVVAALLIAFGFGARVAGRRQTS
ncbi:SdrD B-like domain-containing protein [Lentzea terrae]|uniref:SdrD B-like domain-containing protein n=1 Tax=Lentzea terrae TaxID=2200761 RepID=UPI0018E57EFE|nr:SdrD B-like domain-containing protein [Lentzea terrae]